MSGIYYGYLTESERDELIFESTIENEFNKLQMLFEMRCMQFEQNCRDAELKVLTEGGTYDDLEYLIGIAAFEAQEQGEGIIAKMINWIKTQWEKLTSKIKQILGMGDPEEQIEVPEEEFNAIKKFADACKNLTSVGSDITSGRFSEATSKITTVLGIGIGAGVAVGGGVAVYKATRGELQGIVKVLDGIKNNVIKPIIDLLDGIQSGFKAESTMFIEGNEQPTNSQTTGQNNQNQGTQNTGNQTTPTGQNNQNQGTNNSTQNVKKTQEKKTLIDKAKELLEKLSKALDRLGAWCTRNVKKDKSNQAQPENRDPQPGTDDGKKEEPESGTDDGKKEEPQKTGEPEKAEGEQPKAAEQPRESDKEASKYGLEKNSLGVYHGKYKGYLYQIDARNEKVTVNIQSPKEHDHEGVLKFRRVDNINHMPHKEIIKLVKMMQSENTNAAKKKRSDEIAAANKAQLEEDRVRREQVDIDKKNKRQAKRNSRMFNEKKPAKTTKSEPTTEESVLDMSDVRELLGDNFIVECTEDTITIYTETAPNNMEEPKISREHSIFGSSVDFDTALESAEERSSEFNRLAELIDSL